MEPITTLTGYILSRFLHGIRIVLLTTVAGLFISHTSIARNIKNKAPSTEDAAAGIRGIPFVINESLGMSPENSTPDMAFEKTANTNDETKNYNTHQNNYKQLKASTSINEIAAHPFTTQAGKPQPGEEIEIASAKLQAYHILFTVQQKTGASDAEMNLFQNYYYDKLFATDVNAFWKKVENKQIVTDSDIQNYAQQKITEYVNLLITFRGIEKDYPSSIEEYSSHNPHRPMAVCNPGCDNIGFENGNLNAWSAYYAQN